MTRVRTNRTARTLLVGLFAVALMFTLAGCGDDAKETVDSANTAKGGLAVAESALETTAPDAKLLVVQTAEGVTATATPVWAYLFGSPETDATYLVYVAEGESMGASEYGVAGLSAEEWAKVPGADGWKIDSDDAYEQALEASGADGDPAAYYMGFQTYVPESFENSATASAFTWYVSFDPGESGATTGTIEVNAEGAKVVEQ